MKLSTAVKPISYVKAHAAEVIRDVHDTNEVVIISQNGEVKAVIQSMSDYEKQQESMAMLKLIHQSRKNIQAGHKKEASQVFEEIRNRIATRSESQS
ncbi:MAG: type II toxin-antitoxin system Phd/YefM family antitoxin [Planctomycetes bacterium]|nr:type II toxin-antitoxin system Phd/YefM family antitoxin [Planctomycetota bacterium]